LSGDRVQPLLGPLALVEELLVRLLDCISQQDIDAAGLQGCKAILQNEFRKFQ
jgi:hypothetical protein